MKLYSLAICIFCTAICHAQDIAIKFMQHERSTVNKKMTEDTSFKKWKTGGNYRLTAGQGSLSNWAGGGDDFSLSVNSGLFLFAKHRHNRFSWDNMLELGLGFNKTTSLGLRKNDDKIDLVSKHNYCLQKKLKLSTLLNFHTQFLNGYSFTDTSQTISSAFLSPGYILLSEGLDYQPTKELSLFISPITSRWVMVAHDSLAAKAAYGVDSSTHSINQLGAFATINYNTDFTKNFT